MSKLFNFLSKKDIRSASAGSVIIKFGSAFFAFLNAVILARYMSVADLGYYVLVFTTMTILAVPATMGLPFLLTRYISKYVVSDDFASIKGLLIKSNTFVLYSTLAIYAVAFATYFFWWKKYDSVIVETLLYGFLLLPLLGLSALRASALRGMKLVILAELPDTLLRNLWFTVLLVGAVLIDYQLSPKVAIIFQIFATALSFLLGLVFLNNKLLRQIQHLKPVFNTKEWIRQTIPFSINSGIQVVRSKLLNYILVWFGSVEAVAIFDVAMRGANLVAYTLNALNSAISPFVSSAFEKKDMVYLQRIIKKTGRIIFMFSLPVGLVFIVGGKGLVQFIFGEEYGASYIPLVILCIGQLVSSMAGSVGLLLSMTGNQKVFSNSNIQMLIILVVTSIPMVIYLDVTGAAIVISFTLIIQNIILLKYVRKNLNINTSIF
ncbi:MAG: oligosaccharide flippase family protein [Flavobacteriaceae bacterium]|nr:oligosaccharide flippase family protein [Flavobacteriaceae bacterium]